MISSVLIILILMVASSLCMYSLENAAQSDVFTDAFSGIWWAVSTLLTIGYGDIYPITTTGKLFSIILTFLGVGMVAIPTGILSAGFVDQFSRIKRMSEYANEKDINFIKIHLTEQDFWSGLPVKDLRLPSGFLIAAIQRDERVIVPRGNVILRPDDILVLGAASYDEETHINLKEIVLRKQHPWNGERIKDLDMSRQTIILMVKRDGKTLIPNGNFILMENDTLITYTQVHRLHDYETTSI